MEKKTLTIGPVWATCDQAGPRGPIEGERTLGPRAQLLELGGTAPLALVPMHPERWSGGRASLSCVLQNLGVFILNLGQWGTVRALERGAGRRLCGFQISDTGCGGTQPGRANLAPGSGKGHLGSHSEPFPGSLLSSGAW